MTKHLNQDEIVAKNPKVHADLMAKVDNLLARLDRLGIGPHRYSIQNPFVPTHARKTSEHVDDECKACGRAFGGKK